MPQSITIEVLYPWLEAQGTTEDQIEAIIQDISDNNIATQFDAGAATLLHRDTVIKAFDAIDGIPTKWDTEDDGVVTVAPESFHEYLRSALMATGIEYWLIGADTLPLHNRN